MRSTLAAGAAALTIGFLGACGTSMPSGHASPSAPAYANPTIAPADAAAFWGLASHAFVDAGRVKVVQAGADGATEFHYEPTASERTNEGKPVVVCLDRLAYFLAQGVITPGKGATSCGVDAFVDCFRAFGGPADGAYSTAFEANTNIVQRVGAEIDGTWTWTYSGDLPHDGPVTATVRLDPATGRILRADHQNAQGTTTWTMEYGATFAPIIRPRT